MEIRDILVARNRIKSFIRETPLEYSFFYSRIIDADVYFKLENLQITGSFKVRGALNKMLKLSREEREKGVVTASAGNHGLGVAYASDILRTDALICIPENTPENKIRAIKNYDCNLKICGEDYDETEKMAEEKAVETGRIYISPYNDVDVIAGQGTIGLEILMENPEIDIVLVPVGGGGLISGIAVAAKKLKNSINIFGVQSYASPSMYESIKKGKIVKVDLKPSIAEGIHGNIEKGSITFDIVRKYVDDILLVSEKDIANAIKLFLENHHLISEGAGAVGLAAISKYRNLFRKRKIAIVISGGNIDLSLLKTIISDTFSC